MMMLVKRWLGLGCLAGLALMGAARTQEPKKGEADKLDLETLLNVSKEEVIKTDMEEAGEGDSAPFEFKTDDDVAALEVKDVYRNDEKTFFEVSEIHSKGQKGGAFTVKRTRGKGDLGQRLTRVQGKGPYVITKRITLLDLYEMGGIFMHPILTLMIAMFVLAANSIWIYRRNRQIPEDFLAAAEQAVDKGEMAKFRDLSASAKGLFPQVCRAMADHFETSSITEIRTQVEAAATKAVTRLRIPARALNLVAAAAPLLGLLGTIVGMVIVFEAVATSTGVSKATALAAGIRVKLFCTAFALCVAIPSLFLFWIFNQRCNVLVAETESLAERFMHKLGLLRRRTGRGQDADEGAGLPSAIVASNNQVVAGSQAAEGD